MKTSLVTLILLLFLSTADSLAGILRVGAWTSSGTSPHSSLTSALAVAQPGDEVWVVSNTYREAEFIVPSGVSVYGGFTGSETSLSERNYAANVTILDGSGAHRVATVSGLLDGFTLRNGRTGDNGGGVLVRSGGILSHCIAFANEAGYDGGGVYVEQDGAVSNTLLTDNRSGNDGAGLSGSRGFKVINATAVDNTFTDKPEIKKALPAPASLTAGEVLDVAEPDILNPAEVDPHGSTILMKGWELGGHAISMPYTVSYADNGKKLRYWAANAVGVGVSNEVAVSVTWTVTSHAQLLTPKAVCEGTTLAAAGITNPAFSPAPDGGATYTYYIDGTPIIGPGYQLQYSDNGKLLTCDIKNNDGTITGTTTPAVRLAVMKAPDVLLTNIGNLSIEEGQPLCLPTPVVISNGSDVTAQGWKWHIGAGVENTFNSCDKATTAMNGATVYYTAENGCSTTPTETTYTTLTVTNPVGEFLQTVSALCAGMTLDDCISFAEGGNTGDYYIGNTYIGTPGAEGNFTTSWDDIKTTALTTAHNLQVLRFSYNGGKSERRMTLTVHAVPEITTDPVTPGALCLGDAHTLTIEATGDNLSYQWERSINSTDGEDGDWDNVPGSTTAACRLTADVSAYYRCAVTGVCIDRSAGVAGGKITSAAAQLTVNDRPVIPDVTTSTALTLCEGETVTALLAPLRPVLSGTPATSEGWTLGGIDIADDYPVVATDNGKVFGYRASNACGERTITFSTLKLTVDSKPRVTQDPLDVTAVEDTPVRLSVSASGSNLTYRWQQKAHADADIDANWHDIAGETNPAYSYTAANITTAVDLDGADVLTDYRCVVGTTNACAATTVASALATVTVTRSKAAVSIRRQPAAYEVCNSATAPYAPGFTVEVEGSGRFIYKWYEVGDKATPVAQTPASGNLADAVDDKTNTFQPTAAGTYFCAVTSTDDHAGAQTQTVMLTVSQAPVINGITPTMATICAGGSVTLGVDAVGSALTYQWYQQAGADPDPDADTPKGTAPTFTPVGLASTAKFYCVVGSGSVCTETETSNSVEVTIEKAPKITTQPVSQSVCGATGINLSVVAENTDTYQWYYNGTTTGTNSATLANVKDGGVYTCVVSKTGGVCGEATSVPALITVANSPEVKLGTATNLTACAGDLVTLASPVVEANGSVVVPGKTGWYLSTAADPDVAPVVSSCVVNTTATYNYKVTYKCSATSPEITVTAAMPVFTVTVNAPVAITALSGQPSGKVCNTAAMPTLAVAATGDGTLAYQWYKDGAAIGGATNKNYAIKNTDLGSHNYEVRVTGNCGSLLSQAAAVEIVKAPVVSLPTAGITACTGDVITLPVPAIEANGSVIDQANTGWCLSSNETLVNSWKVSGTAATTWRYKVAYTCGTTAGQKLFSGNLTVTPNTAPTITTHPKDEVKCAGAAFATLSVTATGTAPTYQWYKDNATQSGATGSSYAPGTTAGVYHCVVSNACGTATSAPAMVRQITALGGGTLLADRTTVCAGESATLTVSGVTGDAPQYVWRSGNATTGTVVGNAATLTVNPTATTTYYCTVSNSCGALAAKSQAISVTAAPAKPTFANGTSAATTCEGDEVTLPAVGNKAANGRWELNGVPKGNITKYKVHSADDGQVFRYVNVDDCGQETGSDNTYTLKVKQPARITQVLNTSPVIYQAGAALNTKVSAPAANHAATSKWTLNGTTVQLSKTTALTDDGGRLTFSVDNGCATGIGAGGVDETSTVLRVWAPPTFTGDGTAAVMAAQVGNAYPYPALPGIDMKNCTVVSQGWILDGASTGADSYLDVKKAAVLGDNNKNVKYRVKYKRPDGGVAYADSKVMGVMRPWDVPSVQMLVGPRVCEKVGTTWPAVARINSANNCYNVRLDMHVNGSTVSGGLGNAISGRVDEVKVWCAYTAPNGVNRSVYVGGTILNPVAVQLLLRSGSSLTSYAVAFSGDGITNLVLRLGADREYALDTRVINDIVWGPMTRGNVTATDVCAGTWINTEDIWSGNSPQLVDLRRP